MTISELGFDCLRKLIWQYRHVIANWIGLRVESPSAVEGVGSSHPYGSYRKSKSQSIPVRDSLLAAIPASYQG